ncbi:YetF domain-containing protein [Mesorhizobium sp. SB112]|uniref:DUF421 domain-containing protein n=1 Tax=Mesorhizobium sp. SB112 TaxID=3151853 RepID=UPI0032633916
MESGFDLTRILLGEEETATFVFYLEVIFRTVIMYLYTIFLSRMVGQGGVGQIGPFEFVLVIAIGSAAGDPMFYPEIGLLQGILVITVVIVLHRFTTFILNRHKKLERKLEGAPLLVVDDGRIVDKALGSGTLTERELFALLRVEGVRDTGEVEHAYFEPNGRLSVFRYPVTKQKKERVTLPG